ncbi:MAG: sensor domain-containing diguanylate cyclase [Planctomycetota bacterium]
MTTSILDKVISCPRLPVLPPVAVELMELIRDPDVEPAAIDALLKRDPALAARILDAVNCQHFEPQQPCSTVGVAAAAIGLSPISSLAAGFSLMDVTRCYEPDLDLLDYWRRCLISAAAARHIATVTRGCNPQDAFIAALMQDIGMLALRTALGQAYFDVLTRARGNHRVLPRWERTLLGFTHAEVGAMLGRKWNLPVRLVDPIRRHHHRNAGDSDHAPIVNTVVLGCQISYLCAAPMRESDVARAGAMSRRFFDLSSVEARTLLAGASRDAGTLSAQLVVKGDRFASPGAILAEANNALVADQCRHVRQVDALPQLGTAPPAADDLAGVADRRRFERDLSTWFQRARAGGNCLGVILVEIDELATLRDGHGPPGAAVMGALVPLLRGDGAADRIVSNYGPGTFAVIAPGASRFDSAKLAERLRQDIERQRIDAGADAGHVQVTASIGVAALEPAVADRLHDPGPLLRLADEALRTARRAGRNCVRIFSPKAA